MLPLLETLTVNENTKPAGELVPIVPLCKLTTELPFYHSVSAGFPSPADDYEEERLNLDEHLVKNPAATFFVRVEGVSMTGAGIYPDDILVVDRSLEARPGDVIIAILDGEFTVKRLIRKNRRYFLKPEHPDYSLIPLGEDCEFQVWGVVTHVIHKPYEL